jgi:phosphoribosylanthranilate isomerase
MIRIKVCGLTDPLNAREVAAAGADFIGFIFYRGSKRYVGDNPESVLFSGIPGHVKKVGVFVNEEPDKVIETAKKFKLRAVQLHGEETPDQCSYIKSSGTRVIKAFGIAPDFDFGLLSDFRQACDYFMFDSKTAHHGGSGLKFRWEVLRDYHLEKPFFLSGGIGPEDISDIRLFNHGAFYAADINSCFESAPGMKDAARVRTFIQEIKTNLS